MSYAGKLIIVADFNIHMDVAVNFDSIKLLDTLEMFNLRQFVSYSTRQNGHVLDLVITRDNEFN